MTKFNLDKLREIAEPRKMTRARGAALKAFPGQQFIHDRCVFRFGYEQSEKDIISIIESRLSEIVGDAQPRPVLRAELEELIKRINDVAR